jgi:hypothetical protein
VNGIAGSRSAPEARFAATFQIIAAHPRCAREPLANRRYDGIVRRARQPASMFAGRVHAAALAAFVGACGGGTLDAGHNNPPDAGPNLLDGLVGHWRFDDGAGSTMAVDSSGRGNDGVLHGLDQNTAWVPGRSLGALETGHAGWVQVALSPSIDAIVDRVTVSAWVNQEGTIGAPDNFGTALSRQIGTGENQYYHLSLFFDGRPNLFITTEVGYVSPSAPDPVAQNTWVHLAGTYDGATVRLYVDGVEVANQPLTGNFAHDRTPIILGGNGNDASGVPTELFPGRIDELMLYGRALAADEIARLAAGAAFPAGARDAAAD